VKKSDRRTIYREIGMIGTIYHIFCTENGKAYVGQTWDMLDERWKQHAGNRRSVLGRAIRKHGSEAFVRTVLTTCGNQEELDAAEVYFGEFFDCLVPNGYSLKLGAAHGRFSQELKRRLSESHRGEKNGMFGKKQSPVARSAISHAHKGKVVPREAVERVAAKNRGKRRTDEQRGRYSLSKLGDRNPMFGVTLDDAILLRKRNSRPIRCTTDGRLFVSFRAASRCYTLPRIDLIRSCDTGEPVGPSRLCFERVGREDAMRDMRDQKRE
jgi:group I intron endonuclease